MTSIDHVEELIFQKKDISVQTDSDALTKIIQFKSGSQIEFEEISIESDGTSIKFNKRFSKFLKNVRIFFHAIFARIVMIIMPTLSMKAIACLKNDNLFYTMIIFIFIILIDGIYVLKKHKVTKN